MEIKKIVFRFPWRAASLFRPRKHKTPGEYAHVKRTGLASDDLSGKIMREMLKLSVYLYVCLSCLRVVAFFLSAPCESNMLGPPQITLHLIPYTFLLLSSISSHCSSGVTPLI